MYKQTPFEKLLRKDEVPENGTSLGKQFEENPKLLLEEVDYSDSPMHSVISLAIVSLGRLNLATLILKPNDKDFAKNADPFYLGKADLYTDKLPTSAGVNFYLALITWQYYSHKNQLSELIDESFTGTFILKKSYYDLFYWENENNERCYTCNKKNSLEQDSFMRAQADWFMRFTYKIFELEEQLKKITQDSETLIGKFSTIFITKRSEKLEIYEKLAAHYLHIAYMETDYSATFSYFIKKSYEYYTQSSYHNTEEIIQLAELAKEIKSNAVRVWNKVDAQQYQPLKECGIAGYDYSIDISEAWRKAFNFAHQKINDQGIYSSLDFIEPNSGRTSLEERHSESSEKLDADKNLTKIELHRRKGEPTMTVNPLSTLSA